MGIMKAFSSLVQCHGCVGREQMSFPPPGDGSHRGQRPDLDPVLREVYEPLRELGKGSVGSTWLMRHLETSELYAVKLIKRPLPSFITTSILREITIQSQLAYGHCGIVSPHEVLLTPSHVAIALEYCSGGTLLSLLEEKVMRWQATGFYMSEGEARYYFKQCVEAVAYCHANKIVHRDIKLENTLLDGSHPPHIKLSDFGTSREASISANLYTQVGTPVYMSPEMLSNSTREGQGYNGPAQDVWACGVLLSALVFGEFPFDVQPGDGTPESESQREHDIWTQQVTSTWMDRPVFAQALEKLTPEFKDLLNIVLQPDECKRATIADIRGHPWYNEPLAARYQAAWEEMEAEQQTIQDHSAERQISPGLATMRAKEIEKLVQLATQRAEDTSAERGAARGQQQEQLLRIDLREESIMASATPAVPEGEAV